LADTPKACYQFKGPIAGASSIMNVHDSISGIIRETVLVIAALFPIVNPLGSAAIFINMVGPIEGELQRILSQKIAIYSFFLLIVSLLWGTTLLSFFGIAIYAVQIGGGLVVTITGWSLLNQDAGNPKGKDLQDDGILDRAFYPYTLPITVGPGSISVAITLGAHLMANRGHAAFLSLAVLIPSLVGIAIICGIIYVCYRYGRAAERLLGKTGISVLLRLLSFILLCIGIQIISNGIKTYLATIGTQ
jgi:multiple antibiotic resistance protein